MMTSCFSFGTMVISECQSQQIGHDNMYSVKDVHRLLVKEKLLIPQQGSHQHVHFPSRRACYPHFFSKVRGYVQAVDVWPPFLMSCRLWSLCLSLSPKFGRLSVWFPAASPL